MKIDICGGLTRTLTGGPSRTSMMGGNRDRMVIAVQAPSLVMDIDADDFMKRVGRPLAKELRRRLLAGLAPSGLPAPASSEATKTRRAYRLRQLERGGRVADRYNEPQRDFPKAEYQLRRRLYNGRVPGGTGGWHKLKGSSPTGVFGLESGLLARSVAFGKDRVSGQWCIFFSNNRAIVGKDGKSAAQRVFGRAGMQFDPAIMKSAAMAPVVKRATRAMYARQARRLGRELINTAQSMVRLQKAFTQEFESGT